MRVHNLTVVLAAAGQDRIDIGREAEALVDGELTLRDGHQVIDIDALPRGAPVNGRIGFAGIGDETGTENDEARSDTPAHLVVGIFCLAVMRMVDAVVAHAGHEALAQRIESEGVVHQLADTVDVFLLAGQPPVEHHRVGILALGDIAAPPTEVLRRPDGVGILREDVKFLVGGPLEGVDE